jgi:hypothetical protein
MSEKSHWDKAKTHRAAFLFEGSRGEAPILLIIQGLAAFNSVRL